MSFDKTNEINNISKSQSLNHNKDKKDNNNKNKEQIIKKNKIINIRIYQNYSTNKNSNTFYPNTNNYIDINNLQKQTNEIGIQTETENGNNNQILITQNNYIKNIDYLYRSISQDKKYIDKVSINSHKNNNSRTFSYVINDKNKDKQIYKHKKIENNIRNNKKLMKNRSCNSNNKNKKIIKKKQNKNNNSNKCFNNELCKILNSDKKSKKKESIINMNKKDLSNYIIGKKNKNNNICDEKNQIAKKFSLFNLKNDNQYMIINDGNYNTNYKENNKISINNIYLNGKSEENNNKYIKKYSPIKDENNCNKRQNLLINNFLCKTSKNNNSKQYENIETYNTKFNLDGNRKLFNRVITPEFKKLKIFKELSVVSCNEIFINKTKKNEKYNIINKDNNINKTTNNNNYHLYNQNNNSNIYNALIKNINENVNKYLSNYISKNNNIKNDLKENIKSINGDISKESLEILSDKTKKTNNIQKHKNYNKLRKMKNKDNNNEPVQNKDKKITYKKFININKKVKDNNKLNIKYDSFLQDMTKEEDNDILFEDLLKTYSEETNKENISKENNEIIGDEKTFFNSSKIPKIEEFKFIQKNISNRNTINNLLVTPNITTSRENTSQNRNKPNLINIFDQLHDKIRTNKINYEYKYEYECLNKLAHKRNEKINEDNKMYDKFMKEKRLSKNNLQNLNKYKYNDEFKKINNKEKMYNFIFNEKLNSIPYNNELKLDLGENEKKQKNNLNNIIDKINTEIKSNSIKKLYRNYSHSKPKINNYELKYKSSKRDKRYKNSYSKYYLNKLEIENKYLIPQLNNKKFDYFN